LKIYHVISLLLLTSTVAYAIIGRHDVPDSQYLVSESEFPALLDLPQEGHGLLIAKQWIVTAAHATQWRPIKEVLLRGRSRVVAAIFVHPGYKKPPKEFESGDAARLMAANMANDDIALIKLAEPVKDVDPVPLYREANELGAW
jgi:chymotrypsin